jgi:signal transduction histidine kinase
MKLKELSILLLGLVVCSIIFIADISFSLGAISIFYVIFMLLTFWLTKHFQYLVGSILSSIILTIIGWSLQTRYLSSEIDLGIIRAVLDYEGLFRAFTLFILVFVGIILLKQKKKEVEVQKLNETLELRILARTSASESRAKRLERQIDILKAVRELEVSESLHGLDNVIQELKDLKLEMV